MEPLCFHCLSHVRDKLVVMFCIYATVMVSVALLCVIKYNDFNADPAPGRCILLGYSIFRADFLFKNAVSMLI